MTPKSFIKSKKIVANNAKITGTVNVPNQKTLDGKTAQELSKMTFEKVEWKGGSKSTFGITNNAGESVKSGTYLDFNISHVFDPSKKITKIVTIHDEGGIAQINFFSGEEVLCKAG